MLDGVAYSRNARNGKVPPENGWSEDIPLGF